MNMHRPQVSRNLTLACGALLLATLAACGKGGGNDADSACNPAGAGEIAAAVSRFVSGVTPLPRRFLVVTSGDSALPAPAQAALQAKGPMYFFPADSAQQQKVIAKLQQNGKFTTVLVLFRGMKQADKSRLDVHVAGRFVGGDDEGTPIPPATLQFGCRTGQWQLDTAGASHTS